MLTQSRMDADAKGEGRGKGKNLGFCFPKSTRSSRARGEGSRNGPKDTCCFELLATVAGQLLQESADLESGQNNSVSVLEKETANFETSVVGPQISHLTQQTNMEEVSEVATNGEESVGGIDLLMETEHPQVAPLKRVESFTTFRNEASIGKEYDEINKCSPRIASRQHEEDPLMQGKVVVGDDYDPTLVSSSSSEDAPSFSQKHKLSEVTTLRHDNSCLKARDDDGNSSESTVMETNAAKALRSSSMKESRARKMKHAAVKTRARGSVSKRKRHDLEEAVNSCPDIEPSSYPPRDDDLRKEAFPIERCCHHDGAVKRTKTCVGESDCQTHALSVDNHIDNGYCPPASKIQSVKGCSFTSSPHASASSPKYSTKTSGDSHVKLNIKSFRIPELIVELPESATVANLKKAVMEAAMNLLGDGLCVRVLLEGKKILDETASLLQTGISGKEKSGCLSFMLEPSSLPTSTTAEDSVLVLSRVGNHSSSWYSIFPKASDLSTVNHASAREGAIEVDLIHSETQAGTAMPSDKTSMPEAAGALILHPTQGGSATQGLGVVPLEEKASDVGASKRRMRRPFTVYEVESLVGAVEKLGTGRWRDVKLHAFAQSKHRTYVDLKDKWKTLVHTASIAPHQRRGEPVPQGLLDRVIHAHSYWTANTSSQALMCGY